MNPSRLDRLARWITLLAFALALAAFVAAPFLALRWSTRPFLGFVVEQTRVVVNIDGEGWAGRRAGLHHPEQVIQIGARPIGSLADLRGLWLRGETAVQFATLWHSPPPSQTTA